MQENHEGGIIRSKESSIRAFVRFTNCSGSKRTKKNYLYLIYKIKLLFQKGLLKFIGLILEAKIFITQI